MPSKKKPAAAGTTVLPSIPKELIEQLSGSVTPMTAEQINATNHGAEDGADRACAGRRAVAPPEQRHRHERGGLQMQTRVMGQAAPLVHHVGVDAMQ